MQCSGLSEVGIYLVRAGFSLALALSSVLYVCRSPATASFNKPCCMYVRMISFSNSKGKYQRVASCTSPIWQEPGGLLSLLLSSPVVLEWNVFLGRGICMWTHKGWSCSCRRFIDMSSCSDRYIEHIFPAAILDSSFCVAGTCMDTSKLLHGKSVFTASSASDGTL
ncbi:hypothetical protein BDV95DRAFT_98792 [Massariosphaeria phaeospora]|uniref:Uncharacterized protein n=1 Tax=Massariosphaeria phaeospora TaxID=100035 RepID=A0A7C8MH81_9PLEO|nr:hypothetical protein BDV95DRAFT_98792 [Massariosphaeria phaeospora]